jgi:mono/diheme cytochrome c family protein
MPSKQATKSEARRNLVVAAIALGIGALAWWLLPGATSTTVDVKVPELSPMAEAGREAFQENCAACHGSTAGGTDKGPPLVHKWYQPGHHADVSFVLAAKRGAPQHHWHFGNMPPQPQVGERSMQQIIEYVRELQQANGIE